MSIREILTRAAATAVQSFCAVLIAGGMVDDVGSIALWQKAGVAALAGVLTVAHRTAGAVLERSDWTGPLDGAR